MDLQIKEGLNLVARFAEAYRLEYDVFPFEKPAEPQRFCLNSAYSCGDAEMLYSMIRDLKPRRIIEWIGLHDTLDQRDDQSHHPGRFQLYL